MRFMVGSHFCTSDFVCSYAACLSKRSCILKGKGADRGAALALFRVFMADVRARAEEDAPSDVRGAIRSES
jgi:hypothetical protein